MDWGSVGEVEVADGVRFGAGVGIGADCLAIDVGVVGLAAPVRSSVVVGCATGTVPQATVTRMRTTTHMLLAMTQVPFLPEAKKQPLMS